MIKYLLSWFWIFPNYNYNQILLSGWWMGWLCIFSVLSQEHKWDFLEKNWIFEIWMINSISNNYVLIYNDTFNFSLRRLSLGGVGSFVSPSHCNRQFDPFINKTTDISKHTNENQTSIYWTVSIYMHQYQHKHHYH